MRPAFSKSKKRSSFASEEDDGLRELVQRDGQENWSVIASRMPKRRQRQVQERWLNYLSPRVFNKS